MEVFEGQTFSLAAGDRAFLAEHLRGRLEHRKDGYAIVRMVGHLTLLSGEVLRIRSRKATAASLLTWMAYTDPTLGVLHHMGRVPASLEEGDIAALAAWLFVRELLLAAHRNGLVRRYQPVSVTGSTVRGRIDFAGLVRHGGDLSRLPCVVWERRTNTRLNQFLAAALLMAQRDKVMREACGPTLDAARDAMAEVHPSVDPGLLANRLPLLRTEQPFEGVCALARLILQHSGLSEGSRWQGPSFLVNLEALFERAVVRAFHESRIHFVEQRVVPYQRITGGEVDEEREMRIDLWCPGFGGEPIVVDAKYKSKVSTANLQQMVTYCVLTGARRAVLVLPADVLDDRRSFLFDGAPLGAGKIRVDVAELRTDGKTLRAWRSNAQSLVQEIQRGSVSTWPTPPLSR